jgi:hypothetical protein
MVVYMSRYRPLTPRVLAKETDGYKDYCKEITGCIAFMINLGIQRLPRGGQLRCKPEKKISNYLGKFPRG